MALGNCAGRTKPDALGRRTKELSGCARRAGPSTAVEKPYVLVMKFGGTSLGDRPRLETVASLVQGRLSRRPVLVCSAHAGVTDLLLAGAREAAEGH